MIGSAQKQEVWEFVEYAVKKESILYYLLSVQDFHKTSCSYQKKYDKVNMSQEADTHRAVAGGEKRRREWLRSAIADLAGKNLNMAGNRI